MNTNKAAYWIAVGALALGLNSEYRHGNLTGLHRVADRVGSAICQVTTRAEKTLAMAILIARPEGGEAGTLVPSTAEAEVAQARAARFRERSWEEVANLRDTVRETVQEQVRDEIRAHADVIRARAGIRRAEIEMGARSRFRLATVGTGDVTVFCPRTGTWITLDRLAEDMVSPYVEMGQAFEHNLKVRSQE
jgi:hypothetical protein